MAESQWSGHGNNIFQQIMLLTWKVEAAYTSQQTEYGIGKYVREIYIKTGALYA